MLARRNMGNSVEVNHVTGTTQALRLTSPGQLLATIPHLFSFHPTDNFVVICLWGWAQLATQVRPVRRFCTAMSRAARSARVGLHRSACGELVHSRDVWVLRGPGRPPMPVQ